MTALVSVTVEAMELISCRTKGVYATLSNIVGSVFFFRSAVFGKRKTKKAHLSCGRSTDTPLHLFEEG